MKSNSEHHCKDFTCNDFILKFYFLPQNLLITIKAQFKQEQLTTVIKKLKRVSGCLQNHG